MMTRVTPFASPLDRPDVPNAAAELNGNLEPGEHTLHRAGVHRFAGKRPVEVDDVQIFETGLLEVDGFATGSTLKTVALSMSPWISRTHSPFLRSMAGNRIKATT